MRNIAAFTAQHLANAACDHTDAVRNGVCVSVIEDQGTLLYRIWSTANPTVYTDLICSCVRWGILVYETFKFINSLSMPGALKPCLNS